MTLENRSDDTVTMYYQIDYTLTDVPEDAGYFHAQFRRVNPLPYKSDYVILDGVRGKGQYVGTYMAWGVNNSGWWGEGESNSSWMGMESFRRSAAPVRKIISAAPIILKIKKSIGTSRLPLLMPDGRNWYGWPIPQSAALWLIPLAYHGPHSFRIRPEGDDSGVGLAQ